MRAACTSVAIGTIALALSACSASPEPVAFENQVFYAKDQSSSDDLAAYERLYPPLDLAPKHVGVEVLTGAVRLSRPKAWMIRSASLEPQKRFIEYISPSQYVVAIYERLESPEDSWNILMKRYEEDVRRSGGKILREGVPVATRNAQGRAYFVKRPVAAPKAPLSSFTREYLLRSDHRVVLLQVVHPGESVEPIAPELLRPLETFEVN